MATDKKLITLKTLNKSNVWELQENDVFRIWSAGEKDADMTENINRYITILRSAFEIEEVKVDPCSISNGKRTNTARASTMTSRPCFTSRLKPYRTAIFQSA